VYDPSKQKKLLDNMIKMNKTFIEQVKNDFQSSFTL